jgi:hypothetical protein
MKDKKFTGVWFIQASIPIRKISPYYRTIVLFVKGED